MLLESSDKITGPVLQLWSSDGRKLASVERGQEALLEVILDASKVITWICSGVQGYMRAHADTQWLRVIRASEGHTTTTWRCYRIKPPPSPSLTCDNGHGMLDQDFGASGFQRFTSSFRSQRCCSCGRDIKNGYLRWTCPKCGYEVCLNCAEEQAWEKAEQSGGASGKLEDFLDADILSQGSTSSPSPPRNSRRRSQGGILGSNRRSSSAHPSREFRNKSCDLWNRHDGPVSLEGVPFLGERPLGQSQADTQRRLRRLLAHGDAQGAYRTLARAKQLDVATEDLATAEADLKLLEAGGPFYLLEPQQ